MTNHRRTGFTLLMLVFLWMPAPLTAQARKAAPRKAGSPVDAQVRAIRDEAKRIDSTVDTPQESGLTTADKTSGKWEISGAFRNSSPLYLLARYKEGSLVREESYYFRDAQLILARVEKSWDVDDDSSAPGPDSRREFYLQDGRLVRQVTRISSKPPVTRLGDTAASPAWLIERSGVITKILQGSSPAETIESLNEMPAIEARRP